ncbi:MAG: PilZ domain-containing protein [Gammaproteobacteria bacterium]
MIVNSLEFRERRTSTRYPVALSVEFENGSGYTVDMSTSGALIKTSQPFLSGDVITFWVLQSNQHDCVTRLYCKGVVVRVEQDGEVWMLGVNMEVVRFGGR